MSVKFRGLKNECIKQNRFFEIGFENIFSKCLHRQQKFKVKKMCGN